MEKAPKARVPDLDKRKYLVPSDLSGNALSLPWPFLPQQSLPSPSCVNAIVGLRRGRTEESEWDAPESWVIQWWWCNCSFPSPISLSFPHCCRTLFDLEAAECESWKKRPDVYYISCLKFRFVIVIPVYTIRKTRLICWEDHIIEILSWVPWPLQVMVFLIYLVDTVWICKRYVNSSRWFLME